MASWLRYGYCFGIQDERPAIVKPNVTESESSREIDLDTLESEVELRGGRCRCSDCEIKRSSSEKGVVLILRSRMSGEKIVLLLLSIAAEAHEAAAYTSSSDATVHSTTVFAETASQKLSTALLQDGKALCGRMNATENIAEAAENDDEVDRQTMIDTASALLTLGSKLSLLPLPLVTQPEEAKEETNRADDEEEKEKERRRKREAALQWKRKGQANAAVVRRLIDHHQAQQQHLRQQTIETEEEEEVSNSSMGVEDNDDTDSLEGEEKGKGKVDRETAAASITGQSNQQIATPNSSPNQQPEPKIEVVQTIQNLQGKSSNKSLRQQQQPQDQEIQTEPKPISKKQSRPPPPQIQQPPLKNNPSQGRNSQKHARKSIHRIQHSGDEETDSSFSKSPDSFSEKVERDQTSQPTFEPKPVPGGDNHLLLQEIRALSEEIRSVKEQQTYRYDQLLPSQTDVQRLVTERDQAILELKKVLH